MRRPDKLIWWKQPFLGQFILEIGWPTGFCPPIINIISRCSSALNTPDGTEKLKLINKIISKWYFGFWCYNYLLPTKSANSFTLIVANRIRPSTAPNFDRSFLPSDNFDFFTTPSLADGCFFSWFFTTPSLADFAHRIAWINCVFWDIDFQIAKKFCLKSNVLNVNFKIHKQKIQILFVCLFVFHKYNNEQTALNNSTSGALSESWSNKNFKHFEEILRNSSLFSTSFVFVQRTSAHFSFNLMPASQSIVYCSTVTAFSALKLSSKKVSHWRISGRIK